MKITIEVEPDRGEKIGKITKIAPNGQLSGFKEYAGRDALVIILAESRKKVM